MGNEIPLQLQQFLRSIVLGGTLALLYDLTRALHILSGKLWSGLLDILVSFSAVSTVFLFVMAEDGELRLFILLGTLGGAVLFFALLSSSLRPIWAFWVDLFLLPVRLLEGLFLKIGYFFKKLFSFLKKRVTLLSALKRYQLREEQTHGEESIKMEDTPQQ